MTTSPSEGPGPSGPQRDAFRERIINEQLTPDQARSMLLDFYDLHRQSQQRIAALEQQAAGARTRGLATAAGVAGVTAGAMTDQGQALIGAAGRGIADGAVWAGQGIADGAVWAGQGIADGAVRAGQEAVRLGQEGLRIGQEGLRIANEKLGELSGWAVDAWNDKIAEPVSTAAHAVGEWAVNYGSEVAAHAGDHATTAGIAAAATAVAVTAATPQLRQGVARAANAASRWGQGVYQGAADLVRNAPSLAGQAVRNAPSIAGQAARGAASLTGQAAQAVRDSRAGQAVGQAAEAVRDSRAGRLARNTMEGAKRMWNHVRSDPRVQYAMEVVKMTSRHVNETVNGVTGAETKLPKTQEAVAKMVQQESASTAIKVEGSEAASTSTGSGETPVTNRTTNPTERGKGGAGIG
jgi:hypothetical protein